MQKTNLLIISVLAVLLVSSALSITAAQDTPTNPPDTTSTNAPNPVQGSPVEGNQSALGVGDLAPIYEHNGEPAFGVNEPNNDDGNQYGLDSSQPENQAQLYGANGQEAQDKTTQDNTGVIITAVGIISAITVGAVVAIVYFHKNKAEN